MSEYFPYTLATVLKYNRHLVQLDDGSIAIQQFIFYQPSPSSTRAASVCRN